MDAATLLRTAFTDLHKEIVEDVGGLTPDELFWQLGEGVNHIGFLLWHVIRDEDSVMCQAVLRRPELWVGNGWAARFEMDAKEQGTGFDAEHLVDFRYQLPLLLDYAAEVWSQTDAALRDFDAGRLDAELSWSSEWSLANLLTTGCLSHGWVHLGEMRQLRGLRGWRFRE